MRAALSPFVLISASLFLSPLVSSACAPKQADRGASEPRPSSERISIETEDGARLAATLRRGSPADPAVLLLHQCDGDRSMYEGLAAELAARGVQTLAIDFRGLGESASPELDLRRQPSRDAWTQAERGFPLDVAAGLRRLEEISSSPVRAIVGASCGGREATRAASNAPSIGALVLLSARLDSESLSLLAGKPDRPLLLIAARGDRGAHRAVEAAAGSNTHPATELMVFSGRHHGAPLFRAQRDLEARIADWLAALLSGS